MSKEDPLALVATTKKKSKLIVIVLTCLIAISLLGLSYYYYLQTLDQGFSSQIKTESYKLRANRVAQIVEIDAYIGQELNQDDLIARYDTTAEIADLALARTALQNIYYGNDVASDIINEESRKNILELEEKSILARNEENKAQKLVQDWSKEQSRLLFELRKNNVSNSDMQKLNKSISQANDNLAQAKNYFEYKSLERSKIDNELSKLKGLSNASSKEQLIAYWSNQMRIAEQKILGQNIFAPFPSFVEKVEVKENQVVSTDEVIISLIPKLTNKIWLEATFPKNITISSNAKAQIIRESDGLELEGIFGEIVEKRNDSYLVKVYFKNLDELNLGANYKVKVLK